MNIYKEYEIDLLAQKYGLQCPTMIATITPLECSLDEHWTSSRKTSVVPSLLLKCNLCLAGLLSVKFGPILKRERRMLRGPILRDYQVLIVDNLPAILLGKKDTLGVRQRMAKSDKGLRAQRVANICIPGRGS